MKIFLDFWDFRRDNVTPNVYSKDVNNVRKTVVCQLALGRTRVSGYTLYDHDSMAFEETTPRDVKRLIKDGVVNGLRLDKQGEILLDEKGFNCKNLLVKSGVGNYRPLVPSVGMLGHGMFALTKVACTDEGLVYEIVSNECARLPITEQKLRALYSIGCLCGCWINDASGMIEFANGVEMIDMTTEAIQERQCMEAKMREEAENGSGDVPVNTDTDAGECAVGTDDTYSNTHHGDSGDDIEHPVESRYKGVDGLTRFSDGGVIESTATIEVDAKALCSAERAEGEQTEEELRSPNEMLGIPHEPNMNEVYSCEEDVSIIFENVDSAVVNDENRQMKSKTPKKKTKSNAKKSK